MFITAIFVLLLVIVLWGAVAEFLLYFNSAIFYLPWTIPSALAACAVGVMLGASIKGITKEWLLISGIATLALTLAIGYLGFWVFPPTTQTPTLQDLSLPIFDGLPKAGSFATHLTNWGAVAMATAMVWGSLRQRAATNRSTSAALQPGSHNSHHCVDR